MTRPTPAIKGILLAGTETAAETGQPAGQAAEVPAFLHGPHALFEPPGDDAALAAILQLPTLATDTGEPVRQARS